MVHDSYGHSQKDTGDSHADHDGSQAEVLEDGIGHVSVARSAGVRPPGSIEQHRGGRLGPVGEGNDE